MTMVNGYCSVAEMLAYIGDTSTNTADDAVIEDLIEGASRYIDRQSGRTFYARTETRLYDLPQGRELKLDDDLLTVTTLTNGNGDVIAASAYLLLPANVSPKHKIRLKESSSVIWQGDSSGNTELVISVAGTWGQIATAPDDIKEACREIVRAAYHRRSGQGAEGVARVTAAGVVIEPVDVPSAALATIKLYRRMT